MSEVKGNIRLVLRLEVLAILLLSLFIYNTQEFSWTTFAILFLVPDISFLGYLVNKNVGAIFYNSAHSLIGALVCFGIGYFIQNDLFLMAGIIWCAHIGFDRALGYGLKYSKGFGFTHLGRIGKDKNV